jgi:hypothetical protein
MGIAARYMCDTSAIQSCKPSLAAPDLLTVDLKILSRHPYRKRDGGRVAQNLLDRRLDHGYPALPRHYAVL